MTEQKLSAEDEVSYLKEIFGPEENGKLFEWVIGSFDILQNRAQILLSLITICLTVSGFSGPQIARSSMFCRVSIVIGLGLILLSAVLLLAGPLQLRWGTRVRKETLSKSLESLLENRNERTQSYHRALWVLLLGLAAYVASVIGYLGIL